MSFAKFDPAEQRKRRLAQRKKANRALCQPVTSASTAVMGGATTGADPKTEPWRCPALLDMARGRACLLCSPGTCRSSRETTVACHSNLSIHGKAGARKADDCYSVWGCAVANDDSRRVSGDDEARAFMAAHVRQVFAWRQVAADPTEPARFRNAARAALERLGATLA